MEDIKDHFCPECGHDITFTGELFTCPEGHTLKSDSYMYWSCVYQLCKQRIKEDRISLHNASFFRRRDREVDIADRLNKWKALKERAKINMKSIEEH